MTSKCFLHSPIPLNVAVQKGLESQSSSVLTTQCAPSVLIPCQSCQCIFPSLFLEPLVVDWHVAFWELLLYFTTILSGVIWRGQSCIAPVEHRETRNVIPVQVKYTHIHYLNLVVTGRKVKAQRQQEKGSERILLPRKVQQSLCWTLQQHSVSEVCHSPPSFSLIYQQP